MNSEEATKLARIICQAAKFLVALLEKEYGLKKPSST